MHVSLCFLPACVRICVSIARLTLRTRYTCTSSFLFRLLEFPSVSIDRLTLRTRYTSTYSFVISLPILIRASITRLTLRTSYTCMSFGCHFLHLGRVKLLFTNWLPVNRVEFYHNGSWWSNIWSPGPPLANFRSTSFPGSLFFPYPC